MTGSKLPDIERSTTMNDHMHTGIAEATRLTQQGRLDEATAALQRALGGTFAPAAQEDPGDTNEPIEVISRLVRATPQGGARRMAVRRPGAAAWTTPGPTLLTRGVQLPPSTKAGKVASASVPEGGRFVERSYTNSTGTRSYKLYIPSGYIGQAVPLIVMLHGCTQSPDDFATGTRMNELSEEHTFLVGISRKLEPPTCRSAGTGSRPRTSNVVGANRRSLLASRDRW